MAELSTEIEQVYKEKFEGQDVGDVLQDLFVLVFARLDERVRKQHAAGTTATVVLQRRHQDGTTNMHCFNVGDSWCTAKGKFVIIV